jgi:hypothetical protein
MRWYPAESVTQAGAVSYRVPFDIPRTCFNQPLHALIPDLTL